MNSLKSDFGAAESVTLTSPNRSTLNRRTISYRAIGPLAMVCDAAIIFAASIISGMAYHTLIGQTSDVVQFAGFAAVIVALFVALGKGRDKYKLSELLDLKSQIRHVALTWTAVFLFLTAVVFVTKMGGSISRGAVLSLALTGLLVLIVSRFGWWLFLANGLAISRFANQKIALITAQTSVDGGALAAALSRYGLQPAQQFILPDESDSEDSRQVIEQALVALRGSEIEEIIVGLDLNRWPEMSVLLSRLCVLPLTISLIPTGQLSELFKLPSHAIGERVRIELHRGPRTLGERAAKRFFDLVIASAALLMLLPLFLMTALAIKLDSPGPVVFRQWRRGFNGRPFQIFKFRTMYVLEDGDHIVQASPNDARVTRVGTWLRRTSIDELPQLFNILQGTMSVVGPRPHAMAHDIRFDKIVGKYAYRQHVKPGMTGWAQVHGRRGQTLTVDDVEERTKLDLWYIDNWSLAVDFKILFMTVTELLFSKNAY